MNSECSKCGVPLLGTNVDSVRWGGGFSCLDFDGCVMRQRTIYEALDKRVDVEAPVRKKPLDDIMKLDELKKLSKLLAKFAKLIHKEQPLASQIIHTVREWAKYEIDDV